MLNIWKLRNVLQNPDFEGFSFPEMSKMQNVKYLKIAKCIAKSRFWRGLGFSFPERSAVSNKVISYMRDSTVWNLQNILQIPDS